MSLQPLVVWQNDVLSYGRIFEGRNSNWME